MLSFFTSASFSQVVYESSFLSEAPKDFKIKKFESNFSQIYQNHSYTCYVGRPVNSSIYPQTLSELQQNLIGQCFEFTHTGYWYFKFCPFKILNQFRYEPLNQIPTDNFILGQEDDSKPKSIYNGISYDWNNGDKCVVTNRPRHTKIEYICDRSTSEIGYIAAISEPDYCEYLVQFHTPYVCGLNDDKRKFLSEIVCIRD